MAGAYAHIVVMNVVASDKYLDPSKMPIDAQIALNEQLKFCELGAVSPDYPYLSLTSNHKKWADEIHLGLRTKLFLNSAINEIKELKSIDRDIAFAWLSGFLSHIITDVTIHPVVNLKVGIYKWNEKEHRVCEMNQDSYIYDKRMGLDITFSEHLKSGISKCTKKRTKKMHPVVKTVWENSLKKVFPEQYAANPPKLNTWHKRFIELVDGIADETEFIPLSRHLVDTGLAYPKIDEIKMTYIEDLKAPITHETIHYDDLFEKAVLASLDGIKKLAKAIYENNPSSFNQFVANWNLDTGRVEGDLQFWV